MIVGGRGWWLVIVVVGDIVGFIVLAFDVSNVILLAVVILMWLSLLS